MMHPCIRDVCLRFYYGSCLDALADQLPHLFEDIIPERAVALVTTCICVHLSFCQLFSWMLWQIYHALFEYRFGTRSESAFTAGDYAKEYEAILYLIYEINSDDYHHAKWVDCRQQWAQDGM